MQSAVRAAAARRLARTPRAVSIPAGRSHPIGTELRIGDLRISGRAFLAPLAGVSDWPFRVLARAQGAPLAYTEMVSSEGLQRGGARTHKYLERPAGESPFAVQIFGADPEVMGRAAGVVEELGADLVDVNMGCPVKKVCKTGAGSALLQDPRRVYAIVRAMTRVVEIPVQIKVRSGWDAGSVNVVEVARAARDAGGAAIAIHGRTRAQSYEGVADWDVIARVKREVPGIVVIGNGDIVTAQDALRALTTYGVDAVMIGRGACGYPWIFREIDALARGEALPAPPTYEEWRAMIRAHLDNLIEYRGGDEGRAVREFRKHLVWYSRGRKGAGSFRSHLAQVLETGQVEGCLDRFFPPSRHHELNRNAQLVTGPLSRAWG